MSQYKPLVGDEIIILNPFNTIKGRQGKVTKILPPKPPSPGGLVVENAFSIFYVAPWEQYRIVQPILIP